MKIEIRTSTIILLTPMDTDTPPIKQVYLFINFGKNHCFFHNLVETIWLSGETQQEINIRVLYSIYMDVLVLSLSWTCPMVYLINFLFLFIYRQYAIKWIFDRHHYSSKFYSLSCQILVVCDRMIPESFLNLQNGSV